MGKSGKKESSGKTKLVLLQFHKRCGFVCANSGDLNLKRGEYCICDEYGKEILAKVLEISSVPAYECNYQPIRRVIRKASKEDIEKIKELSSKSEDAMKYCIERIKTRDLKMKMVKVEIKDDEKKIIFYYTADGRVDFRELVKDLAARFRTRIEMRQIGVRDEAKLLAGCGICGRTFCCSTFLANFSPISIRMAKKQNINLNPAKISGICGRLMCCLDFELDKKKSRNDNYFHNNTSRLHKNRNKNNNT